MAGEQIATNSGFGKTINYIGTMSKVDTPWDYYLIGHSPTFIFESKWWVLESNSFTIYLYYRLSNGGAWNYLAHTSGGGGDRRYLYGSNYPSQSHYLRWRFAITGGDGEVRRDYLNAQVTSMYSISNTSYPKGRNLKVGVASSTSSVSREIPSYTSGNNITTSNFLIYKE